MSILLTLAVFLSIVSYAGYERLSYKIWWPALLIWLLAGIVLGTISFGFALPLAILFAVMGVWLFSPSIRQKYFTTPLLNFFKRELPPISATEQEALSAGGTYWETDLMRGMPEWQKLYAIKSGELSAEEQSFLDKQTEDLCKMLNMWNTLCEQDLPEKVWRYLKEEKFFGLIIPKEFGGLGFSTLAHSTVVLKIATCDPTAAVTAMVPNSLGPGELLIKYGTSDQKNYYLPRLAKGEEVPCFGLTELMAGSDAGAMEAQGVVMRGQHEGKEVIGIRLNWDKRYITLAPIATIIGIAFKLSDPQKLLSDEVERGITVAMIPAKHPGVQIGERHMPLVMGFMNGPIHGKDVFIPLDWIIGGKENIGHGWRMLMECLAAGRGISLPALGTALAKVSYRTTGAYAAIRQQFNVAIGRFPGIQEVLGRMGGMTYLVEATRLFTAAGIDQGFHSATASSITKYFVTETSRKIVDDAMDIHGGRGIILGPRNYIAYGFLAQPVGITVEGANILTRSLMIFGQGAIRCHPYILDEMAAATIDDEKNRIETFDKLIVAHIGYVCSNIIRLRMMEVVSWFCRHFHKKDFVKTYQVQMSRMSTALAVITDLMFAILGGELKRQERISARLADIVGYLYMGSAVLHYYQSHQCPSADIPYFKWCMDYCIYNIQKAFIELANNFPKRIFRFVIHRLCFPFTLPYRMPNDVNIQKIALSMQELTDLRDRITQHMYISKDPENSIARVEFAFIKMTAALPSLKKIHMAIHEKKIARDLPWEVQLEAAKAQHIIDAHEIEILENYYSAYRDALAVDAFPAEEIAKWFH